MQWFASYDLLMCEQYEQGGMQSAYDCENRRDANSAMACPIASGTTHAGRLPRA
ncbi:hypothetical protein L810_8473 [Burkholderia sp. AU4i]|nr:hypothetical protein L810_8473 [Burkholderia sp. AU4i]